MIIKLLTFLRLLEFVVCDIACYHCRNTSIHSCGNRTITCRRPADACYITLSESNTMMSRSCVWNGHCLPQFLCNGVASCDLHCCYGEDLCNNGSDTCHLHKHSDARSSVDWFVPSLLYVMLFCILVALMVKISFPA